MLYFTPTRDHSLGHATDKRVGLRELVHDVEHSSGVGGVMRRSEEYSERRCRPRQGIARKQRGLGSRSSRVQCGGKAYRGSHDTIMRLNRHQRLAAEGLVRNAAPRIGYKP
jgi:hypothetical protein